MITETFERLAEDAAMFIIGIAYGLSLYTFLL